MKIFWYAPLIPCFIITIHARDANCILKLKAGVVALLKITKQELEYPLAVTDVLIYLLKSLQFFLIISFFIHSVFSF